MLTRSGFVGEQRNSATPQPGRMDRGRSLASASPPSSGPNGAGEFEREVSRCLAAVRFADFPVDVVRHAKLLILDSFGVMVGGFNAVAVPELNRSILEWES